MGSRGRSDPACSPDEWRKALDDAGERAAALEEKLGRAKQRYLTLSDSQAPKFWPVYVQYAAELAKIGVQQYALIKEYAQNFGSLRDEHSLSLVTRSPARDEAVEQLRIKYVPIVNTVLPGKKTATFFQIDRRITALIDLQLAS